MSTNIQTAMPHISAIRRATAFVIFCIAGLLATPAIQAQTDTLAYTADFRFSNGIFQNIEQLRRNKAIPFEYVQIDKDPNDINFLQALIESEQFGFLDSRAENIITQKTSDLWGLAWKGVLYINWNGEFNRVPIVGQICHFVANKTVQTRHFDPYYYQYSHYSPYAQPAMVTTSTELTQYMLDIETGKIVEYTEDNLATILMRDPQLYDQFMALKKKKRREQKFLFLRKYNDKHLLYFPVY